MTYLGVFDPYKWSYNPAVFAGDGVHFVRRLGAYPRSFNSPRGHWMPDTPPKISMMFLVGVPRLKDYWKSGQHIGVSVISLITRLICFSNYDSNYNYNPSPHLNTSSGEWFSSNWLLFRLNSFRGQIFLVLPYFPKEGVDTTVKLKNKSWWECLRSIHPGSCTLWVEVVISYDVEVFQNMLRDIKEAKEDG